MDVRRVAVMLVSVAALALGAAWPGVAIAQGGGATVSFQQLSPFVISLRPVIRNGAVGGVSVDSDGLVRQATEEATGKLGAAWQAALAPADLPDAERWPGLKAIGVTISEIQRGGTSQSQVRYYLLSEVLSARRFAAAVRDHWSIENRLHWQLDVTFQEDQCRVRLGHADANLSILRRTVLSLLKNNHTYKVGLKTKCLLAAASDDYLQEVLFGQ